MQIGQILIPQGVDFDNSPSSIKSDKAFFLKGIETGWTIRDGKGQNSQELKPSESNYLYCSVTLPLGDNKVIGYYYYSEANEGYIVTYNSLGNHIIYRLRGIDGTAEIVYEFCKNFDGIVDDPKYYFSEGRITIKSLCRFLPDGAKELYKELYLVNKKVDNLRIVVEDSIATKSFTTPFFTTKDNCCGDRCRIIKSGVPTPMGQIKIVPIPVTEEDKLKQNRMLFQMFQFRFVAENAWGQRSEHGLISEIYSNNTAGCSKDSISLPHCIFLETKKPCPEIVKLTVEYRSCQLKNSGIGTDGNLLSDWIEAFHIDLYDKTNANLKWFERVYDTTNKEFEFFNDGKNIRIRFCNNREKKTVALSDIRNQNPAPINSGTVASIAKGLAYGDNENNLGKILKEDIDKISLELVPTVSCEIKYSRIKVWAVIHNYDRNVNEPTYINGSISAFGGFGDSVLTVGREWESLTLQPEGGMQSNGGYGQRFPDGVKGFRGRLLGTQFVAESKQFLWTPSDLSEIGILDRPDVPGFMAEIGSNFKRILVQCFDFGLVPSGTYQFGINGHNDTVNVENTSTYYRDNTTWSGYRSTQLIVHNAEKQIFIDTTSGVDYDSMLEDKVAVIQDLTYPGHNTFAVRGYLYEDDLAKQPIELAEVHKTRLDGGPVGTTDHNGFYFFTTQYGEDYIIQLRGTAKCAFNQILGQTERKKNKGTSLASPIYASKKIFTYAKDLCNRYLIKGKITECVSGAGIEGVAVVLSKTKPVTTNSKGEFTVIAHYSYLRDVDQLIFSVAGTCFIVDCNCGPINIKIPITQPLCTSCVEKVTDLGGFSLKTIVTKGTPHGSRLQIGMIGEDWMGRMTDIQTNESLFIDFPTESEQQNSSYPLLKVKLPVTFSDDICKRFKNITFWWSKNTNYEDFFVWAADQVDFIDNAGNKTEGNPSKVKIWYRSLLQYNLLRGANTNTTWNFLDSAGNTRIGDTVEFIQNADGKYLPVNTTGNIQYDKEGTYFLVDYDASLKELKDGVKFKLKRPYQSETNKTFYEFGFPINFCGGCNPRDDDGNIVSEFTLNTFSSYALPRQIPVVIDVITKIPATTGTGTQDLIVQNKSIKVYPYTFEHHSPSDTWGDHCNNGGRVSYINPYEGKKCDRNQILITGSLNQANDGAINYLHYFSLSDEYAIDEQGWGGIIAMLVRDDAQVLLICELTTFSFRTNDDRAIVDANGYVRLPITSIFGKPERNPFSNFGCQLKDINTIRRNDSMVTFLDSHRQAFVLHDFNTGVDISAGIQSWLVPSIKEVKGNDAMYWHSSFDYRLHKIFITKYLTNQFINNEIENKIEVGETMAYDYIQKEWSQSHFTPEYFGNMYADIKDTQFFSFKNGLPYAHHNAVNPGNIYLNYFGVQCFPVIGVVTNQGNADERSFVANEVHCREILFILERLQTSIGQESKVYEGAWETGAGISYAAYLCDTNNPDNCNTDIEDMLMDGDTLYGRWLKALYIPNPDYQGEFFLLTKIISHFFERNNGNG